MHFQLWPCSNVLIHESKKPDLFVNYDATPFELATPYSEHSRKVAVCRRAFHKAKKDRLELMGVNVDVKPLTTEPGKGNHDWKYYVKYYCVISASGILLVKLVFVAADPT